MRDQGLLLSERIGLRVCTMKFQINMRELEHDYYADEVPAHLAAFQKILGTIKIFFVQIIVKHITNVRFLYITGKLGGFTKSKIKADEELFCAELSVWFLVIYTFGLEPSICLAAFMVCVFIRLKPMKRVGAI